MRATRDELPILFGEDPATIRGADWGELRSMIVSLPAGTDLGPLLQGLPNDLCWPPGHTPLVEEDVEFVEFVEFSPPAEHDVVLDHVKRTAAAQAT